MVSFILKKATATQKNSPQWWADEWVRACKKGNAWLLKDLSDESCTEFFSSSFSHPFRARGFKCLLYGNHLDLIRWLVGPQWWDKETRHPGSLISFSHLGDGRLDFCIREAFFRNQKESLLFFLTDPLWDRWDQRFPDRPRPCWTPYQPEIFEHSGSGRTLVAQGTLLSVIRRYEIPNFRTYQSDQQVYRPDLLETLLQNEPQVWKDWLEFQRHQPEKSQKLMLNACWRDTFLKFESSLQHDILQETLAVKTQDQEPLALRPRKRL